MLHQSNVLDGTDSYVQVNTQGKDLFLLTDLVKSTRIILNNSSIEGLYTYDEYGNVSSPIGSQPDSRFLFQGKKWIGQIRKYDYFTRLFDPETGRFQQRDTRGYSDGTNLYAFLGNNPLSSTDPYGTESRTEQKSDTGDGISKGVLGGAGGGMAKVTPPGPTVPLDPRITDTQLRQYRKAAIIDKVLGKTTQTEALRQHPTQRAAKARFQAESMSVYDPRIPGRGMNRWHMGHLFDLQHWVGDINNPKHRAYIEQFEWQRSSGTSATGNTSLGSTNRSLQSQFPGITSTDLLQGERPPTKYGWAAHLDTAGKWFHSSHLRTGLRWGGRGLMVYGLYLDYGEIHEAYESGDADKLSEKITEKSSAWLFAGEGAVIGAEAGLFCGPAAWICSPVGGFIGGSIGYIAGSKVGKKIGQAANYVVDEVGDFIETRDWGKTIRPWRWFD
jgi:RHS repeat-associated protein